MRVDATSPRTRLLGAVAGWALLVWGLTLFGLGSRIERLPDDPSLAQRLPTLPTVPAERLGPFAQYAEFSNRPLFYEERRPQPFSLQPEGEAQQETFKFVLTSVLLTPRLQLAIIQPEGGGESSRLRVGEAPDSAPSYQLISLTPRGAVFTGPDGEHTLELRVFDGTGGEPPTAVSTAPVNTATGQRPTRTSNTIPPTPAPAVQPVTVKPVTINPAPPATPVQAAPATTSDAQVEEIRKRIEARRAQLREQSQQPPPVPPPAPDQTQ